VLQRCNKGVTRVRRVLQGAYKRTQALSTLIILITLTIPKSNFKKETEVHTEEQNVGMCEDHITWCYKGVVRVLQECYKSTIGGNRLHRSCFR
jgi:hypothetical protein